MRDMPIPQTDSEPESNSDLTEQALRDLDDAELLELIAEGEEDLRNGRTISHEEVKARLAKKYEKE
jgi:predicted transcriptional regulator